MAIFSKGAELLRIKGLLRDAEQDAGRIHAIRDEVYDLLHEHSLRYRKESADPKRQEYASIEERLLVLHYQLEKLKKNMNNYQQEIKKYSNFSNPSLQHFYSEAYQSRFNTQCLSLRKQAATRIQKNTILMTLVTFLLAMSAFVFAFAMVSNPVTGLFFSLIFSPLLITPLGDLCHSIAEDFEKASMEKSRHREWTAINKEIEAQTDSSRDQTLFQIQRCIDGVARANTNDRRLSEMFKEDEPLSEVVLPSLH